jgi:hypothetical protein
MFNNIIQLSNLQRVLFYSAMVSILVQIVCIYYLVESKKNFNINNCCGYFIFTCIGLLFYYKMILP